MNRETDSVRPQTTTSGRIADYRLDHLIGRGGMAAVYLAQDERSDRTVALKVLTPELARDDAFRTRFLRETRAAAAVGHPHIIPVYDVGEAGGSLYLAMRYVQGGDVRSLLNRLGPLPVAWAWNTIAQVASALDAAHAHGLVHRDVKPANLLLDAGGGANGSARARTGAAMLDHVYLSDFGISKDPPPGGIIAMGKFVGNLDYVAPEQIEGRGARRARGPVRAGLCRVRAAVRLAAVRAGPGPDRDVRAAVRAAARGHRAAPRSARGRGPGSGHGAGEEPG